MKTSEKNSDLLEKEINFSQILELLPHRYPFLLVDKVINLIPGVSATGIKNVSFNEPHFNGHFPGRPIMPGVLIVEAMAQTAAVVVVKAIDNNVGNRLVYFMSIDEAKFRRTVAPGDQLYIYVEKIKSRANVWKFSGKVFVDDKELAAEASFTAMLVDNDDHN